MIGLLTPKSGHVGDVVPQEEVVRALVPLQVVCPHHAEVAGEAEQAGAGPGLRAGRAQEDRGAMFGD